MKKKKKRFCSYPHRLVWAHREKSLLKCNEATRSTHILLSFVGSRQSWNTVDYLPRPGIKHTQLWNALFLSSRSHHCTILRTIKRHKVYQCIPYTASPKPHSHWKHHYLYCEKPAWNTNVGTIYKSWRLVWAMSG